MARPMEVPGYDVEGVMERVRRVMHTSETLANGGAFIDLRRSGDLAAARALIPTELVDELSYVGSAEKIRAKLRRLEAIGISHVFITPPESLDVREFTEVIKTVRP